jgi:hypothetical protein
MACTSGRVRFFGGRLFEAPPGRMLFSPDCGNVARDHIPVKDSLLAAHLRPAGHPPNGDRQLTPRLAQRHETCLALPHDAAPQHGRGTRRRRSADKPGGLSLRCRERPWCASRLVRRRPQASRVATARAHARPTQWRRRSLARQLTLSADQVGQRSDKTAHWRGFEPRAPKRLCDFWRRRRGSS